LFASCSRGHPPNRFDTTVGRARNAVKFEVGISAFFAYFPDYCQGKQAFRRRENALFLGKKAGFPCGGGVAAAVDRPGGAC
jgi:hypothetical protein